MKILKPMIIILQLICLYLLCPTAGSVFSLQNNNKITLYLQNTNFILDFSKYQVNSSIHTVIWEASKYNRKRGAKEQAQTIQTFLDSKISIESAFDQVFPSISKDINKIEKQINTVYKNARMVLNNQKFDFIPEKEGYELEKGKLYLQILEKLQTSNFSALELPIKKTQPKIKVNTLKKSVFLRSSFETNMSTSTNERKHNIKKAISQFNGKIIYPGETLSFNEVTGSRTARNGYQEAKIIVNGEYVAGVGGGVCQASTTLYNACLLAGLKCSAHNHTIPPTYVKKGLDAMVNSGTSDLKITNTLQLPIYIQSYCTNDKIVVRIFGENLNGISYKTKSVILEETPSKGHRHIKDIKQEYLNKVKYKGDIYIKQRATNGYKTATYLQTYKNNKLINEQLIRKNHYPATEGIIIEGILNKPIIETPDYSINIVDNLITDTV